MSRGSNRRGVGRDYVGGELAAMFDDDDDYDDDNDDDEDYSTLVSTNQQRQQQPRGHALLDLQNPSNNSNNNNNNRRRWNTQNINSVIPNREDRSGIVRALGPVNTQYSEYLNQLQERNRHRRQLEEMDSKNKELRQREQGFNLCFSGANNSKGRSKSTTASRSTGLPSSNLYGGGSGSGSGGTTQPSSNSQLPVSTQRLNRVAGGMPPVQRDDQEYINGGGATQQRRSNWNREHKIIFKDTNSVTSHHRSHHHHHHLEIQSIDAASIQTEITHLELDEISSDSDGDDGNGHVDNLDGLSHNRHDEKDGDNSDDDHLFDGDDADVVGMRRHPNGREHPRMDGGTILRRSMSESSLRRNVASQVIGSPRKRTNDMELQHASSRHLSREQLKYEGERSLADEDAPDSIIDFQALLISKIMRLNPVSQKKLLVFVDDLLAREDDAKRCMQERAHGNVGIQNGKNHREVARCTDASMNSPSTVSVSDNDNPFWVDESNTGEATPSELESQTRGTPHTALDVGSKSRDNNLENDAYDFSPSSEVPSKSRPRPISQERRMFGSSSGSRSGSRRASRPLINLPPSESTEDTSTEQLSSLPSPIPPSKVPDVASSVEVLQGVRDRSQTPRRRPSTLEQSMDSLMHFAMAHSGRLKPRDTNDSSSDDSESDTEEESMMMTGESTTSKPSTKDVLEASRTTQQASLGSETAVTDTLSSGGSQRSRWRKASPFAPIVPSKGMEQATGSNSPDTPFEIPLHPTGKKLTINCKTSWGDPHYIGLSGIELFDRFGRIITFTNLKEQVLADPPDINILPEYTNDPRTVDKLFDGVNNTCDDMHVWLAPYTPGKNHFIYVAFDQIISLGMIRFWNYNKSRIHSYRGVRHVEILLDGVMIFKGEIEKAPGTITGSIEYAESILFTNDEKALAEIEMYDSIHNSSIQYSEESSNNLRGSILGERPSTASKESVMDKDFNPALHFKNLNPSERPTTSAIPQKDFFQTSSPIRDKLHLNLLRTNQETLPSIAIEHHNVPEPVVCQYIRFDFESSWGDLYYVGLTGIQVLDETMNPIAIASDQLTAVPRDMNAISGHSGDYRTLDKLVDGENITTDDSHMWLIPLTLCDNPHLIIDLRSNTKVCAIRVYNYNKSLEDSFRGCKKMRISLDDRIVNPEGHIIRKAPGTTSFDFGHTIYLSDCQEDQRASVRSSSILNGSIQRAIMKAKSNKMETPRQDYECALLPTGYVFKFHLLSTHGDPHYIGLNGIELYDAANNIIPLTMSNIQADPQSITELPECANDMRTLDKLIDRVNDTWNDRHMWLAPYVSPDSINLLYVIFDEPVAISMIKIWNYSKTPERGVEDLEIYVDDVLFYKGELRRAPSSLDGQRSFGQSILFTNDPVVIEREKPNIYRTSGNEQMVVFINNNSKYLANQEQQRLYHEERRKVNSRNASSASRPMTSIQSK